MLYGSVSAFAVVTPVPGVPSACRPVSGFHAGPPGEPDRSDEDFAAGIVLKER